MFKTIKSAFRSIALATTIIFGAILAPEAHNFYLRWEVGESVVQVLHPTKFGGGTGFAVEGKSGKKYIMTNKHVCEVAENGLVRIKPQGESAVFKKVIYKDTEHDLCLIEGLDSLAPLTIGSSPAQGEFHYVVGHPGLRNLTVSQGEFIGPSVVRLLDDVKTREECVGEVLELDPLTQILSGLEFACIRSYKSYSITSVIYPGNSGSPIVNKFGNLIAVAFAGSSEEERDNYAVPLHHIIRILNQY